MDNKKKLLILVDWFMPGYKAGGPIQSCVNLCKALKNHYNIYVLTTDTDHGESKPYQGITANTWLYNEKLGVHIYYAKKSTLTSFQLATQMAFVNADIIYLNHLFSPYFVVFPLWLKFRNRIKSRVVVCPRGALYSSALSLKSYKKIPLLYLYKWMGLQRKIVFHATNDREKKAIEKYYSGSEIIIADNLPAAEQPAFTSCLKQSGKLNCIFISRIVPIKNLLFLLQILQQQTDQITLTITGPVEDESYWQECKKCIAQLPENIIVVYSGAKEKETLPNLIKENHLFILPTTGENFGHAIFEAMLCGRPVLISDQTPWLNLQHQSAGWDLPLSEPGKFIAVIKEMAAADQVHFDHYAKGAWEYAQNFIGNSEATKQYFNLFK